MNSTSKHLPLSPPKEPPPEETEATKTKSAASTLLFGNNFSPFLPPIPRRGEYASLAYSTLFLALIFVINFLITPKFRVTLKVTSGTKIVCLLCLSGRLVPPIIQIRKFETCFVGAQTGTKRHQKTPKDTKRHKRQAIFFS